jgi:hypothetical protein
MLMLRLVTHENWRMDFHGSCLYHTDAELGSERSHVLAFSRCRLVELEAMRVLTNKISHFPEWLRSASGVP